MGDRFRALAIKGGVTKFLPREYEVAVGPFKLSVLKSFKYQDDYSYTISVNSLDFFEFYVVYGELNKKISELPRVRLNYSKYLDKGRWLNVGTMTHRVTTLEIYKKNESDKGISDGKYSLDQKLSNVDEFYVTPDRIFSFIEVLEGELSSPELTYRAAKIDGVLSGQLAVVHQFEFLLYAACRANISYDEFYRDLNAFIDAGELPFAKFNPSSLERLYHELNASE